MAEPLDLNRLDGILQRHKGEEGALIPILQEAQEIQGYLSEEVLNYLGKQLHIPVSRIFGVITFYAQFYMTPRGRHTVRVCRGTACHVRGGKNVLKGRPADPWASERMRPRRISNSPLRPWPAWEPAPCPRCFWWTRLITGSLRRPRWKRC